MIRVLQVVTVAFTLALVASPLSTAADEDPIVGRYRCDGSFKGGKAYGGTVVVTKRGESYQVAWDLGGEKWSGVGILDGDTFAAQYTGNETGVFLFKKDGNNWNGKWVRVKGLGLVHTETWKKLR